MSWAFRQRFQTAGPDRPWHFTNSIGMKLRLIAAGWFLMGSGPEEEGHSPDEGPRHRVHIKNPFYLGVYPVTQRQFEAVLGYNPSRFTPASGGGPDHPVEGVSWEQTMRFCAELSRLEAEKTAGRVYELPTEAEWEYACRAGTETPFSFGRILLSEANFNGHYPYGTAWLGPFPGRTTPVSAFPPNAWGLYDMHGNVWEWCNGYYYDEEHLRSCRRGSEGAGGERADPRVVRGGCWNSKGEKCRAADRYTIPGGSGYANLGFRVLGQVNAG
jgi:formylglycine-generating enzyme required for sulfatase activity